MDFLRFFGKNKNVSVSKEKWEADGFYALPGFYSKREIDAARSAQEQAWANSHERIVVDDLVTGARKRLKDVDDHARGAHRFKLNDLYLELPEVRGLAINQRITPILNELLGETTVLCNSLSFDQGSSQPDHVDAIYMTPKTPHSLIAIWVALEDCHLDAGPLRYYPGSHKIKQYEFSNGSTHFIPSEMDQWDEYMQQEVSRLNLSPQIFAAKKGDVFIWSCYLLHGGSQIKDMGRTRKSLVFHYFGEGDCVDEHELVPADGGLWMYRAHQPVPGENEGSYPPKP
jgi:ectoine hydroxylase-related dioxygenase (phytanoyl-CoA dioxygenase family)